MGDRPAQRASPLLLACGLALLAPGSPVAETISHALAQAYVANPFLNQQRASGRATDEGVAIAEAGYRPKVQGSGGGGIENSDSDEFFILSRGFTEPRQAAVQVSENLFDGNRTRNRIDRATSQVMRARELTRDAEQTTLLNAATAYMNVLRDVAIIELDRNETAVLREQLRQTKLRSSVGAVTPTDVAQAESSLAFSVSSFSGSRANLAASIAGYRRVIGSEPRRLEAARPIDALLPASLAEATSIAVAENPQAQAALHEVDVQQSQIEISEGDLYPTVDVVGSAQRVLRQQEAPTNSFFSGSVLAQVSVPVYEGGQVYASIRAAKERLSQARLRAASLTDRIRADIVAAWGRMIAAREIIKSSRAAVDASERALRDVRQESEVGKRTTLDVLRAQQTLLQSRVGLVRAERDYVVMSYVAVAATGRLSAESLDLDVDLYDPTIHLAQVKDKWAGLRTPDGN